MSEAVWEGVKAVLQVAGALWLAMVVIQLVAWLRRRNRAKATRPASWPIVEFDFEDRHWVLPNLEYAPLKVRRLAVKEEPVAFLDALGEWGGEEVQAHLEDWNPMEIGAFIGAWAAASGVDPS